MADDHPDGAPDRRTDPRIAAVLEELAAREPIFHRPEQGTSRADFEALTAPDFWETGASGRRYGRAFVIETAVARHADPGYADRDAWQADDFQARQIAPDVYLLTYTLRQPDRVTRRLTVWRRVADGWQVLYHQGTVVE
jgi:hypothetical protein